MLSCAPMGNVRRTKFRQFIPYLLVNVVLSALTMIVVLTLWEGRSSSTLEISPTPTLDALSFAASRVPTATSTRVPSATPHTYRVQPGDTLGSIAIDLGVSIGALMGANGIEDPDALSVGQLLIVPVEGPAPTSTPPGVVSATSTPIPDENAPQVEIRGVAGAGDLEQEVVRILNSGGAANMQDWTLDDGAGNEYVFPAFTLHNGAVSVHTRSGTDTVIDLFWGRPDPVWTAGKIIRLRDAEGNIRSTFSIPAN